jgi:hypothetical protein
VPYTFAGQIALLERCYKAGASRDLSPSNNLEQAYCRSNSCGDRGILLQ